jgi:hypothetical protein
MADKATRKELKTHYRENPPEAGVYSITNTATGRTLLGSSTNLPSVSNKLEFAKTTNLPGAMDQRLRKDIATHGIRALTFDILEVLEPGGTQTDAEVRADLKVLEDLWRDKLTGTDLY